MEFSAANFEDMMVLIIKLPYLRCGKVNSVGLSGSSTLADDDDVLSALEEKRRNIDIAPNEFYFLLWK